MTVRADVTGSIQGADSARSEPVKAAWRSHPVLAKALRIAVVFTPVAASVGIVLPFEPGASQVSVVGIVFCDCCH